MVCTALACALITPVKSRADSLFYHFNNAFSGATPQGSQPWVNALFTDVSPGVVKLTISVAGLVGNEFLSALDLNLSPALSPGKLQFSVVSGTGVFANPVISTGANKFKADGDGKYDVNFVFSSKSAKTFGVGDSISYDITYKGGGLTAADFDFLSTKSGHSGPFVAAAQISGIPGCDSPMSGWIAPGQITLVPEPGTVALLALGAGVVVGARWIPRRARRS